MTTYYSPVNDPAAAPRRAPRSERYARVVTLLRRRGEGRTAHQIARELKLPCDSLSGQLTTWWREGHFTRRANGPRHGYTYWPTALCP